MLDTLVNIVAAGRFASYAAATNNAWHTFQDNAPEAAAHIEIYRLNNSTEVLAGRCWGIPECWIYTAAREFDRSVRRWA